MAGKIPPCSAARHKYKNEKCVHCGFDRAAVPVLPPPPPRPDGLEEHQITWGQVGIGHVLLSQGRKWTVLEARQPAQYDYGRTCWFKVRAARGEEHSIPPKMKRARVTALLEPGATHPAPAYAVGEIETELLESVLGGLEVATKDNATGEVWCPWFPGKPGDDFAAELLHLQVAHGMEVSGLTVDVATMTSTHAQAHNGRYGQFGKGGFSHRHMPEDLSIT